MDRKRCATFRKLKPETEREIKEVIERMSKVAKDMKAEREAEADGAKQEGL